MLKIKLLGLGLVFFTFSAHAQTKQNIIGTWQFEDFYKKNELKMDSAMLNGMKKMFADMVLTFNENSTYLFHTEGKDEKGTWAYLDKTKKLKITKSDKNTNELAVIAYSENSITLSFSSMRLVFRRKL